MKFVHVTDPHLVPPGERLWGLDPCARLDACLTDIETWHGDADFCVISGDLADRGDLAAYTWLRERLARFPLKTFLMVGNHDDREGFRQAFPGAPADANGFIQGTHVTAHGTVLFLDTLKGGGVAEGAYCAQRRDWLADALASTGEKPVFIFMHHPPFDIGLPYMDRLKLDDPEAFTATLAASPAAIRHLFFGHVHRSAYVNWNGIACTCLPGSNHQVPLVQASVGEVYSDEPPCYGVVTVDDHQVVVHFDAYMNRTPIAKV